MNGASGVRISCCFIDNAGPRMALLIYRNTLKIHAAIVNDTRRGNWNETGSLLILTRQKCRWSGRWNISWSQPRVFPRRARVWRALKDRNYYDFQTNVLILVAPVIKKLSITDRVIGTWHVIGFHDIVCEKLPNWNTLAARINYRKKTQRHQTTRRIQFPGVTGERIVYQRRCRPWLIEKRWFVGCQRRSWIRNWANIS